MTTTNVSTIMQLNAAIVAADSLGAGAGALTIDLMSSLSLAFMPIQTINLQSGVTLEIDGNGNTLDGGGVERGLFVYSGSVTIDNLALNNFDAAGGVGAAAAGGGAGLGGALYIGDNVGSGGAVAGSVTLANVTFTGDAATGGAGGGTPATSAGGGGGGGLGGNGGNGGFSISGAHTILAGGGGGGGGINGGGGSGGTGGAGGLNSTGRPGSAGIAFFPSVSSANSGGTGAAGTKAAGATGGSEGGGGGGGGGGGSAGLGGGGGGGGIGGSAATAAVGAIGGYGGGGGGGGGGLAGGAGGAGGFGGGGGGGGRAKSGALLVGGKGGVGGGGGDKALGGFGAGNGYGATGGAGTAGATSTSGGGATGTTGPTSGTGGGGGGLAAGGDIFVQAGASLVIAGAASIDVGTATGGGSQNGQAGIGFASGIYLQGAGNTLNFQTTATQTVAGVIGDDAGSAKAANYGGVAGYTEGAVGIAKTGAGTLTLSAPNTYTGGTALNAGTLDLANVKAAGSGGITFATGSGATLKVELGDAPANILYNFIPFDTIDIANIGMATGVTLQAGNVLAVTGGNTGTIKFNLNPAQSYAGDAFGLIPDGAGGTDVIFLQPISITPPTQSVSISDEQTAHPFSNIVITDPNLFQTETAVVTPSSLANGTLSDPNAATDGGVISNGTYTVSGSAAAVAMDLDGLVFTPKAHEVAPGSSVTTNFGVVVTDTAKLTASAQGTVIVKAVNDAPKITGTQGNQQTDDCQTINPFSTASVTDVDVGVTDSLTIVVKNSSGVATDANGMLSGTGLTKTGTGAYTLAAATPVTLSNELEALTFTPTEREVAPGKTVTTTFSLTATQTVAGSTTTSPTDSNTSVVVTGMNYIYGGPIGFCFIVGTCNPDMITAYGYFNTIYGQGGNDCITAGCGNAYVNVSYGSCMVTLGGSSNTVCGGDGDNTVVGAPGGCTTVTLGNGNNTIEIGGQNDHITLGCGNNVVTGTQGWAFITAGSGNDTIILCGSNNTVNACGGTNTIVGGNGYDTFILPTAGKGFDTISNFTLTNCDVLNLHGALAGTCWNGSSNTLANVLKVTSSNGNTFIAIAANGSGAGVAIAELAGAGNLTLAELTSHHSIAT